MVASDYIYFFHFRRQVEGCKIVLYSIHEDLRAVGGILFIAQAEPNDASRTILGFISWCRERYIQNFLDFLSSRAVAGKDLHNYSRNIFLNMSTKLKGTFSYPKTMENAEMRDMNVPSGFPEAVVKTSSSSKFTFTVKGGFFLEINGIGMCR